MRGNKHIRFTGRGAVALCLAVALLGLGAARTTPEPAALCLPLFPCSPTTPSPAPTSPSPTPSSAPLLPLPGGGTDQPAPAPQTTTPAVPDGGAPTFTLPAAQLGGSSISFSGLHSVSAVTVPLANGTRTPVIKIVADEIVITGFVLDVRKATGPSLVSTADRMTLQGHVQVYIDSATATLADGTAITFGAATPPPGNELPPTLLRVNLGLVGVTADSIAFANPHQAMK